MGFSSVSSTVAIPRKRFNGIPTVLRSSIEPAIEPLRYAELVEMTGAGVSTGSAAAGLITVYTAILLCSGEPMKCLRQSSGL